MFEYLAQVQSAVRRINDRIKTLSEKFGTGSDIVNNLVSSLDVNLKDNFRFKDGVPQIHTPSEIYNDDDLNNALEYLDSNVKTWGSIRSEYSKQYEAYKSEAEFFREEPIEIQDFISTMQNLDKAFAGYDSSQFPDKALEILRGKHKSYNDLNKVTEILKKEGFI